MLQGFFVGSLRKEIMIKSRKSCWAKKRFSNCCELWIAMDHCSLVDLIDHFHNYFKVSFFCFYLSNLKEIRNSFKKWPLYLWWIWNKTVMEFDNIAKTAIFNRILHLSYKNTQLLFLWQCFVIFSWNNINRWFLGVTQKYQLRVTFKVKFSP